MPDPIRRQPPEPIRLHLDPASERQFLCDDPPLRAVPDTEDSDAETGAGGTGSVPWQCDDVVSGAESVPDLSTSTGPGTGTEVQLPVLAIESAPPGRFHMALLILNHWREIVTEHVQRMWKRRNGMSRGAANYTPRTLHTHWRFATERPGLPKNYKGWLVKAGYVHHCFVMLVKAPLFTIMGFIERPMVFYPGMAIITGFIIFYLTQH